MCLQHTRKQITWSSAPCTEVCLFLRKCSAVQKNAYNIVLNDTSLPCERSVITYHHFSLKVRSASECYHHLSQFKQTEECT